MPPQLPNGSFPASAAETLGLSQKQLRREGIVTLSRGLRLPLHSTGTVTEHLRGYTDLDPECCLMPWFRGADPWHQLLQST